jgi:hypothetical protein
MYFSAVVSIRCAGSKYITYVPRISGGGCANLFPPPRHHAHLKATVSSPPRVSFQLQLEFYKMAHPHFQSLLNSLVASIRQDPQIPRLCAAGGTVTTTKAVVVGSDVLVIYLRAEFGGISST